VGDGPGNIVDDPQLLDAYHIAVTSPCRGAGLGPASGTDLDGEPWFDPPSIGCDEVWESELVGPLTVSCTAAPTGTVERVGVDILGSLIGRASRVAWSFGDGSVLTNGSYKVTSHTWTNAGDFNVTFTAFNTDHSDGVSTNLLVHVAPLEMPALSVIQVTNGRCSLQFPAQARVPYEIEKAISLVPPVIWQRVTTRSNIWGGLISFTDYDATNAATFYRTRVP
jgi:hypothetical protein